MKKRVEKVLAGVCTGAMLIACLGGCGAKVADTDTVKEKELNKLAEIKGMPLVTNNNDDDRFNNAPNPEKCEGRYVYDGQLSSVNSIICDTANKMGYGDITTVDEAIDMIKDR